MKNLLKKEIQLSMHSITPLMLLLSAMVLIPNYPYGVIFFYMTLAMFFTCMLGRENGDVVYSMTLPIAKSDIVKARMLFAVLVELLQLLLLLPFIWIRQNVIGTANAAGMDGNLALLAEGFLLFGIFHLVFFCGYYKDVTKVGVNYVKATVVFFLCICIEIAAVYAVPFVRDCLDTPDSQYVGTKLITLAICILIYVLLTVITYQVSVRRFEKQDLRG